MPPPSPPLFRILKTAASSVGNGIGNAAIAEEALGHIAVPRLGSLALPGRKPVATPAFFAVTSRGAVPHVTPDNIVRTEIVNGAYFALEDLPRLHAFSGLPTSTISVLAPRRHPAAASHLGNGPTHISIVTSTGFQKLTLDAYHAALDSLRPDIAVPMADLTYGSGTVSHTANPSASTTTSPGSAYAAVPHPNAKRAFRMAERSEDWIDQVCRDGVADKTGAALFVPTLPVPYATQWQYLNRLAELAAGPAEENKKEASEQAKPTVAGLAVYDVDLMQDLHADYADTLGHLPRLSLHPAVTPHHVLRQVSLGIDVMLLPAITDASEQGLAYAFFWEASSASSASSVPREAGSEQFPLAIDLTDPVYKADFRALQPGCSCTACATHHRAYLHHLLDAREMLAWTLLQLHNHHVMTELFAGIRKTLESGGVAAFQEQARRFRIMYEPEMPLGRGQRPRLRGYQVKTDGVVEAPLNKPQWGRLEDVKPGAAASPVVVAVSGGDQMVVDA
ncbi:hypothetical protein SCUCBS95973_004978 [Sporothrix curviconia]|uniref:Queuine tRNA-ribosyltransferase accessory subunit 2 n=1 Tax=Sporothrix curviconia TaxID=1260050 RepID=A0ABP0BTY1_9PEZI